MSEVLTKEFLYKEYVENKKSIREISKETKLPSTTVYDAMIEFSIPIKKSKKFQIPRDVLYVEYTENKKTIKQISDIFGCSGNVISTLLKKYNIPIRVGMNYNNVSIVTKELLEDLYIVKDYRIREIAEELNMSERYIGQELKKCGIPRKRAEKKSHKIDLTGQKFGRITVISLISNDGGKNIWACVCECGKNMSVQARLLLDPGRSIKSCSCARASNCEWKIIPPYLWNSIRRRSKQRSIEFKLTKEYCENLFLLQNKRCALSGVDLMFGRSRENTTTTASLDRINSDLPYEEGNVQWIHKDLNRIKNIFSNDEFINWCKLIADFKK